MYAYHCIWVFKKIFNFINYLMISSIYHMYVIWKCSVLYENVFTSYFNYILNVFVCLSLYVFFSRKSSIFKLSYVILNFIIHMIEENFHFKRKCLYFILWLQSNCICENYHKNLQFLNFSMIFPYIIRYMFYKTFRLSENVSTSFLIMW